MEVIRAVKTREVHSSIFLILNRRLKKKNDVVNVTSDNNETVKNERKKNTDKVKKIVKLCLKKLIDSFQKKPPEFINKFKGRAPEIYPNYDIQEN